MKTILTKSNFTKKEGVAVRIVVLDFVYILVMNKKISTFLHQSDDSYKKDVYYYRLLSNSSYNWRSLLTLSISKILSKLHKIQDTKAVKVFILDIKKIHLEKDNKVIKNIFDVYFDANKTCVRHSILMLRYSKHFHPYSVSFHQFFEVLAS